MLGALILIYVQKKLQHIYNKNFGSVVKTLHIFGRYRLHCMRSR